jgi:phosphatidylinositol-3-phosphatase
MRRFFLFLFLAIGVLLAVSNGCAGGAGKTTGASAGAGTFSISISPAQQTVIAGSTATFALTVTSSNNFTGTISFGVTGLPSGTAATFNPSSLQGAGNSTLTITTSTSAPAGTVSPTVSATSGSLSQSASLSITVTSPVSPDFSLSATPASQNVTAGSATIYAIRVTGTNGFNGSVSLKVSGLPSGATGSFSALNSGSSTLSVTTASSTPAGNSTLTVTGASGSLSHSTSVNLVVSPSAPPPPAPDFSISATPSTQTLTAGASVTYTLTAQTVSGFNGTILLTAGSLPVGVTTLFNPSSLNGGGSSTVTVATTSSTPAGSYTITLTGTSVNLTHSASVNLTVNAAPSSGFSLSASPGQETVAAGASTHYTITVTPSNGFSQAVTLSVRGLPAGATGSFNPNPVPGGTGSSTLLVQTASTTPVGNSTLTATGSGGGQTQMLSLPLTVTAPAQPIKTVFLILMENNNWSSVKGNATAPYINNTLLAVGSHAEQYYNPPGNHPSLPNYLWLEAGTNFGISNDNPPSSNHQSTTMHLVTLLKSANISWKSYDEDISGTSCPLTDVNLYAVKHNPFVYFDDVTNTLSTTSAYCIAHVRPYTELATDLQNNTVASYNFITPNLCDDMHDCSIATGDTWLANNVPTILNSAAYQQGGVIFITWDEGEGSDGPIGMIVLSPKAKGAGYQNTIHYTHGSTLRTIEEIFGVTPLLGDAMNQTDLSDLFASFP